MSRCFIFEWNKALIYKEKILYFISQRSTPLTQTFDNSKPKLWSCALGIMLILCILGNCTFFRLLIFLKTKMFYKKNLKDQEHYQSAVGLIWVKIDRKGYRQTALAKDKFLRVVSFCKTVL